MFGYSMFWVFVGTVLLVAFLLMAYLLARSWFTMPIRMAGRRAPEGGELALKFEEAYRSRLTQLIGFPVIATTAFVTLFQGIVSYRASVSEDARKTDAMYQEQFSKGITALFGNSENERLAAIFSLTKLASSDERSFSSEIDGAFSAALRRLPSLAADDLMKSMQSRALLTRLTDQTAVATDRHLDLQCALISELALPSADMAGFHLSGIRSIGSTLDQGNFYGSVLSDAEFRGTTLTEADFSRARLTGARFCAGTNNLTQSLSISSKPPRSQIVNAKFYDAFGDHVRFPGAQLSGAKFNDSVFTYSDFRGALLSGSHMFNATFYKTDFSRAQLTKAHLGGGDDLQSRALFYDTNFRGADLIEAEFWKASLLGRTDFVDANLKGADFRDAVFDNVDFTGANLTGTVLTGTNLSDEILKTALICDTRLPEDSRIDTKRDCKEAGGFDDRYRGDRFDPMNYPTDCPQPVTGMTAVRPEMANPSYGRSDFRNALVGLAGKSDTVREEVLSGLEFVIVRDENRCALR